VNPFTSALTRWAEAFANESAHLDPLTKKRLAGLSGHSITVELEPSGESTTLQFDGDSIRLVTTPSQAPSVIVRGTPGALAAAFLGAGGRTGVGIDGDEVVLGQFRNIVRDYRPDVFAPLENLVGKQAAQAITGVFELGFAALSALGRSLGEEGGRLARDGVRQKYLTAPELASFVDSMQALRNRVDRLNVRTDIAERDRIGTGSRDE
jgi:ubiquinone biosynthesis protein UbiJ